MVGHPFNQKKILWHQSTSACYWNFWLEWNNSYLLLLFWLSLGINYVLLSTTIAVLIGIFFFTPFVWGWLSSFSFVILYHLQIGWFLIFKPTKKERKKKKKERRRRRRRKKGAPSIKRWIKSTSILFVQMSAWHQAGSSKTPSQISSVIFPFWTWMPTRDSTVETIWLHVVCGKWCTSRS